MLVVADSWWLVVLKTLVLSDKAIESKLHISFKGLGGWH